MSFIEFSLTCFNKRTDFSVINIEKFLRNELKVKSIFKTNFEDYECDYIFKNPSYNGKVNIGKLTAENLTKFLRDFCKARIGCFTNGLWLTIKDEMLFQIMTNNKLASKQEIQGNKLFC